MARLQQYPLRFEPEERAAWQAAADKAGLPLSQWIRAACNLAAKPFTGEGVISGEQAQVMARDLLALVQPSVAFPEPLRPEGNPCPHPAKERTSYGVCRLCKQKVSR